jgi:hypothetical protein
MNLSHVKYKSHVSTNAIYDCLLHKITLEIRHIYYCKHDRHFSCQHHVAFFSMRDGIPVVLHN